MDIKRGNLPKITGKFGIEDPSIASSQSNNKHNSKIAGSKLSNAGFVNNKKAAIRIASGDFSKNGNPYN